MALAKQIMSDFGVAATYWNIGAVAEDFKGKGTQVTTYGYLDEASRAASKQPLSAQQVTFVGDQYTPGADRAALYEKLKATDFFKDATDA